MRNCHLDDIRRNYYLLSIGHMKAINCFWEERNIGKKTVEISIGKEDRFERALLEQQIHGYEYAVVKVPMNMPSYNIGLTEMGFTCIESQMNIGISLDDFDFTKVDHLYQDVFYKIVDNQEDFDSVLSCIEPGMFSTDRISLDPQFGEQVACQRYINWLTTEYENKKSLLVKVFYKSEHVGFMLIRIDGGIIDLILNGLYKQYQGRGLGLLTPASPMMFAKKNSLNIIEEVTNISSNNIPVVKLYNRLHFQLRSQTYVYVKHLKS